MAKPTLYAAARAKDLADFLARPHTPNACRNCPLQLHQPALRRMICTATGLHYLNSRRPEKPPECPFPTPGGDESWRGDIKWRSIANGLHLCPTCRNAVGIVGDQTRPNPLPCHFCGEAAENPEGDPSGKNNRIQG